MVREVWAESAPADAARTDRETIRHAAAAVRRTTIQHQYRGAKHPAVAFSMALLLDELALHATGPVALPNDVRTAAAAACRGIVDGMAE